MEVVTVDDILDVEETFTEDECVINIVQSGYNRNQWIYKASQLTEEGATQRVYDRVSKIEGKELTNMTLSYINRHEGIKNNLRLKNFLNLSESEINGLREMTYGLSTSLKGNASQAIENYIEVARAIEKMPSGDEISVYNAVMSHAQNGEEIEMVPHIVMRIINGSTSLKKKFRSSSSPYKIPKLFRAVEEGQDESMLISIADTGNRLPVASSKADKEMIKKLEDEIFNLNKKNELLERRNAFLIKTCSPANVTALLRQLKKESPLVRREKKSFLDACKVMGVNEDITIDELKKQYKLKVGQLHSDKPENVGKEDEFIRIIEANKQIKKYIKGL